MDILHFPWGLMLSWIITLLKVFGIIPGAIAANWLRKLYQRRRQPRAMEGWPSTEATIQSGRVQSEGTRHWAEITYTYFVGEYRVGTYLRNFRKEDDANEFVRQLRDKRLHVHYKESNFDTSVILDRDLEMIVLLLPQLRSSKSQSSSRGTMPGAPEPVLSLSKDLAFERWDGNNLDQGSGSEAWSTTKLPAPSFASFLGEGWETTNPNPPVFLFPFHCYPPGAQQ
jgi:hypothetical protein